MESKFLQARQKKKCPGTARTLKALGVRVQFTDSMENGAQGKYEKGTVLIAKDAPDPLKQVYGHEITHRMQELAPTEYAALRSAVQAELGGELEYQVQSRIQLYGRHDVMLSYEEALDEVTADYAGELIRDGQVLEDFIQRNRENRTLLEKLRDAIRNLISKLTGKDQQQARTAEERLSAALDAAAKQAEKKTAREGGGKYSITSPDHVGVVALLHENIHNLKEMDPLSKVDGTEVQKAGRTTERVLQYLDSIGGKVVRPGFGEVIFSRGKIKSSFVGHGIGDAKIDLIAGVPSVIESGKQISFEKNWKNRSYDSYTFAGPVEYKGEIVYLAVIVTKDGRNGNRYYLHEAVDQDGNIIYGNEKKTGAASDRPAQKVRDTIAVSDLDSNIISDPDEKSNGKFSIPTGSDMVDATRLRQENAYAGRSMTEDREIYSYDFLTALPDMQVTRLPEIDRIRNDAGQIVKADVVAEGMKNARSVGTERDGKVFVRNAYTGKNVLVTVNSIRHGLNGGLNRQLTNARLGAVIGDVVRNAVPINALNNKANGVNGTYAMAAYATDSKGREFVAIVTVEQYSGNISGLEAYDVTHAVSGRQKNGSPADTKSQGFYPSTATTISIANLIENVNRTHQSILSDDVLARLGDERDPGGFYTGQVRYSMPGTTQLDLEVKRILSERGDKTDDEIRLEINQAVDRVYQGYVETYGAMQPGEKPAREVQVPSGRSHAFPRCTAGNGSGTDSG